MDIRCSMEFFVTFSKEKAEKEAEKALKHCL